MITASIVAYKNSMEEISRVLKCVTASRVDIIFFIDNSPFDELKPLCEFSSKIYYQFGHGNIGFGAAHNLAIQKSIDCGSKYHVVINPDIYFNKGVIEGLVKFMDEHPDVGLCMPQILYPNGKVQYLPKLIPSPLQLLKRKLPVTVKIYRKWNSYYEMSWIPTNRIYEAPIISGCFSFFRTDVFRNIGFYDNRYFMYFEDFDISRRIHKYYKTVYFPIVTVYHEYGRGAQKSFELFKIFVSSAIKYFNKWGWFFDKERKLMNKRSIHLIKSN